ncbi:MAG: SDR family oxidoreductase [Armatimonadetes bacterium]|nr:SDR family oxidoreductase [Armatimonadota bacterium]
MRLKGRVAIVTGAAHGIGRAITIRFAGEGAAVVAADINGEGAAETVGRVEAAGGRALALTTDVGRAEDVERTVRAAVQTYGGLDILVNNAGIPGSGPVEEVKEEVFDAVVNCNLRGMWLGCHYAVPELRKAGGGSIITTSSVQGILGFRHTAIYAATKAGILGATRALALELAPDFIRVNAICPGSIRVYDNHEERIARRLGPEFVAAYRRRFGGRAPEARSFAQPLPRVGLPEDIANAALFLASDESSFITGIHLPVDGGMTTAHYQIERTESSRELREWSLAMEARKSAGLGPPEE